MKNVVLALMALIYLSSCEAQSTTDPNSNVVAQDPKCLLKSQWGFDQAYAYPKPLQFWFKPPEMYFNTATEGFFAVSFPTGNYKNNTSTLILEIHFLYSVNNDKVIFDIQKVKKFNAFLTKTEELSGQSAIDYALDAMNLMNKNGGLSFTCDTRKLVFTEVSANAKIPLNMKYWKKLN
jgi:hypothetical protein